MEEKKMYEYAVKIHRQIGRVLFDKECDCYIGISDLLEEKENFERFIHALSISGATLCKAALAKPIDILEYNHMCNRLILKYAKVTEEQTLNYEDSETPKDA
jgi:hypothetical protein